MLITCVTLFVKKENVNDFIQATKENHNESRKEDGNFRFDFLQCNDDPTKFFLYEVDLSDSVLQKHVETEHFKKWNALVSNWYAKDPEIVQYHEIAPTDLSKWQS